MKTALSGRFEYEFCSTVAARPRSEPLGKDGFVLLDLYKVWYVLHYDEIGEERTTNIYIRKIGETTSNTDQIYGSGIHASLLPLQNEEWQSQHLERDQR
jgi:hypothetical protein